MFPIKIPVRLKRLFTRKSVGDRNVRTRDNSGQVTINQNTTYMTFHQADTAGRERESVRKDASHLLAAANYNGENHITKFIADEMMRYIRAGPWSYGSHDPSEFGRWDNALRWLVSQGMVLQTGTDRSGTHFSVTEDGHRFRENPDDDSRDCRT
ncbi:MAG: hypothetical protein OXI74_05765 [Rhodospirillaceae bacterium]|nr:hypothetical protein [Rhodospirillaceae bacterium]